MTESVAIGESSKRALEPMDRVSEVLFGLIMVLTFTGSLSVADVGRDDVHEMLVGALGCNLAWGIIDAVFYLMGSMSENGRNLAVYKKIRATADPRQAQRQIADALPPVIASAMTPAEFETVRQRVLALPDAPARKGLGKEDLKGAVESFLLVFLSTFPVTIPFMVMADAAPAMRVSNAIAVCLLFVAGYAFGRISGRHPLLLGLGMVGLGAALVAMTIALGG